MRIPGTTNLVPGSSSLIPGTTSLIQGSTIERIQATAKPMPGGINLSLESLIFLCDSSRCILEAIPGTWVHLMHVMLSRLIEMNQPRELMLAKLAVVIQTEVTVDVLMLEMIGAHMLALQNLIVFQDLTGRLKGLQTLMHQKTCWGMTAEAGEVEMGRDCNRLHPGVLSWHHACL